MSLHAQISPEAQAKLAAQKRNSTISAIIMALLICCLLGVILWIISLAPMFKNNEETVSYSASSDADVEVTKPEMTNQVETKPSAPASSMAKVIASQVSSPVSIPVPEISASEPALDFGDGDDFGDGWGSDFGSGSGSGGGGVSFFKQSVKAERVAYVIDYSMSMKGKGKFELMKEELSKSVKKLPDSVEYQLIFFAGPMWIGGDEIEGDGRKEAREVIITHNGRKYEWNKGGNKKSKKPRIPKVDWLRSSSKQRKESLKAIKETPMIFGTQWDTPMFYALDMKPKPDIIFFMTDGVAGSNTGSVSEEIAKEAKKKGVIVNCIALMEPKAKEHMAHIARESGGIFTEIQKDGKIIEHDLKE